MNYPDLSNILIDTSYTPTATVNPSAPPINEPIPSINPSASPINEPIPSIIPSAPPAIEENEITKPPDYYNLYSSILKQITYSLMNKKYIISEWSNDNGHYTSYIWFKQIFLAKISIVFTNDNNNFILPHTINISIDVQHMNNVYGWSIINDNNKYIYQNSFNLNDNYILNKICNDIYKIITPKYLIPKTKMTFWNLLDGSYFINRK